jgi:N-methylhydantoinase A
VIPKAAKLASRDIYWTEPKKVVRTPVFDGALLVPGNRIVGPCVVETAQTTVVVHPGRTLKVDAYGNFEITFK